MQDAHNINDVKFEVNGKKVGKTQTFITQSGEVFIGLYSGGAWMNVRANEIVKYISPRETFVNPNYK
jgi:hypothetical protein